MPGGSCLKRALGAGMIEVTIALLLVSLATLGMARGQLAAREMAQVAYAHGEALAYLRSAVAWVRAHPGAEVLPATEVWPQPPQGLQACFEFTEGELWARLAWPSVAGLVAGPAFSCEQLPSGDWQQLGLRTVIGEGW